MRAILRRRAACGGCGHGRGLNGRAGDNGPGDDCQKHDCTKGNRTHAHVWRVRRFPAFVTATSVLGRATGEPATMRTMRLSARNQLNGTVTQIDTGAVTTTVKVELAGGDVVTSSITKEAADELGLAVGSSVTVVVKASDVILATE